MCAGCQTGTIIGNLIVTTDSVRLLRLGACTGLTFTTLAALSNLALIIVGTSITIDLIGPIFTVPAPVANLVDFETNIVTKNATIRAIDGTWFALGLPTAFGQHNGIVRTAGFTHGGTIGTLSFNADTQTIGTARVGVTLIIRIIDALLAVGAFNIKNTTTESLYTLAFQAHKSVITAGVILANGANTIRLCTPGRHRWLDTIFAEISTELIGVRALDACPINAHTVTGTRQLCMTFWAWVTLRFYTARG